VYAAIKRQFGISLPDPEEGEYDWATYSWDGLEWLKDTRGEQ
jgi:hypothetical protein